MSQKELGKRRTFDLTREFIGINRKLDALIRGRSLWFRNYRISRTRSQSAELAGAICERYHGLLLQIFNGLSREHSPNCSFERFRARWWQDVEGLLMGAAEDREVSYVFWIGAERVSNMVFGTNAFAIAGLRPKFMLRPLIDEIRNPAMRDVLLTMGYHEHATSAITHFSPGQQFEIGVVACEALYDALSAIEDDLDSLTNQSVHVSILNDRKAGITQLRSWLFGAWEGMS